MDINMGYLEKAYNEALTYANEQVEKCDELIGSTSRRKLNFKLIAKKVITAVALIAIGIIGIKYKDVVFEYLKTTIYVEYAKGALHQWNMIMYNWLAIASIVGGSVYSLNIVFTFLDRGDASGIESVKKSIQKEIDNASSMKKAIEKAVSEDVSISIKNGGNWDSKIISLKKRVENASKNIKTRTQVIDMVICLVATFIGVKVLYPFIISSFKSGFTYNTVLELLLSYGILWIIVSEDLVCIEKWYPKYAKGVTIGLFGLFQFFVIKNIKEFKIFTPIITKESEVMKDAPRFLQSIVEFINTKILTRGFVLIALTTIAIGLYIIYTNVQRESEAARIGYRVPMRGSLDRVVCYKDIRKNSFKAYGLATIFLIIAPQLTAPLFAKEISLVRIFLFLVVGLVMFGVYSLMNNETIEAVLGKKMQCVIITFLIAYIILTLTLIPNPGLGSVVLILIQPFIGLLAVVVFLGMFS